MTRVAIVTGGTRGIGRAISISLRDAGYNVIANYASNDERAKSFSEETKIESRKWDVSDFDACVSEVNDIAIEFGSIDVVVNNAGITRDGTMRRWNAKPGTM